MRGLRQNLLYELNGGPAHGGFVGPSQSPPRVAVGLSARRGNQLREEGATFPKEILILTHPPYVDIKLRNLVPPNTIKG